MKPSLSKFNALVSSLLLLSTALLPSQSYSQSLQKNDPLSPLNDGDITTLVGRKLGDNDLATKAALHPDKMIIDATNNLFFIDQEHNNVRKIAAKTGIITTVAGNGDFCNYDCKVEENVPATAINFNRIRALALDHSGNLFVVDEKNYDSTVIRRVDAISGLVTTVAGGGNPSDNLGDGQKATDAQLNSYSIAVNSQGDLFISDDAHRRIRRVDAQTNIITTVAGNGEYAYCDFELNRPAADMPVEAPSDMVIDRDGNIIFTEAYNYQVKKLNLATNQITLIAGNCDEGFSGDNGPALDATFYVPLALTLDNDNNIYVSDFRNMRIRRIDGQTGIITTFAGDGFTRLLDFFDHQEVFGRFNGDNKKAIDTSLNYPKSIAFDRDNNLFIADSFNLSIRRIDAKTNLVNTIAGAARDHLPRQSEPDGTLATDAELFPSGFEIVPDGSILIADSFNQKIRLVNADNGTLKSVAGKGYRNSNGTGKFSGDGKSALKANLNNPKDVIIDENGIIYIADSANGRIRTIKGRKSIINTIAGNGEGGFCGDGGPAVDACVSYPVAIIFDRDHNLIFADVENHRIRKIAAKTGIITTIAGNGKHKNSGDGGLATNAGLAYPNDLAIDKSGNIYVICDASVRRIDGQTGIITTITGSSDQPPGVGDGRLATEVALFVTGIAVDAHGNLFISDLINHRIRKIDGQTNIITTVAGDGNIGYNGDNISALKTHIDPGKLKIDDKGNLYLLSNPGLRVIKGIAK